MFQKGFPITLRELKRLRKNRITSQKLVVPKKGVPIILRELKRLRKKELLVKNWLFQKKEFQLYSENFNTNAEQGISGHGWQFNPQGNRNASHAADAGTFAFI